MSDTSPATIDLMLAIQALQIVAEAGLEPWVHTSAGWFVRDGANDLVADEAVRSGMEPVIVDVFTEKHLMHAVRITGASEDQTALHSCAEQVSAQFGEAAVISLARPGLIEITQVRA